MTDVGVPEKILYPDRQISFEELEQMVNGGKHPDVVVLCMRGMGRSCDLAAFLAEQQLNAFAIEGGLEELVRRRKDEVTRLFQGDNVHDIVAIYAGAELRRSDKSREILELLNAINRVRMRKVIESESWGGILGILQKREQI